MRLSFYIAVGLTALLANDNDGFKGVKAIKIDSLAHIGVSADHETAGEAQHGILAETDRKMHFDAMQ